MNSGNSIVFINQNSGYLMIDIIRAHQCKFENVTLITGKLIARNSNLDDSVSIRKIISYNRSTVWKRLFTWTYGFIQILFLVKVKYRNAELFIVSNPPLATLLPLFCNNKFHLLVFDVYPDALTEFRILKDDSLVIRMWRNANRRIYSKATNIFTISEGMKTLLGQYVREERIQAAPVWTDNSFLKPIPKKENPFIIKHSFEGKFLVIYSGNLGYTHELEVLVECALKICDPKILFVVIGEGERKKSLDQMIKIYKLKNFILLPWQDVSVLPFSLAAADLAVVSLGKQASLLSVPSKTYNLMSVGAPLLGIASQESELAAIVSRYGIGKCFDVSEIDAIVNFIEEVASNRDYHQVLHSNALCASKEFGPENALKLLV